MGLLHGRQQPVAESLPDDLTPHLRDFVLLHELCHTVHHDHSPYFHALLDRLTGGNEKNSSAVS